jgi:hypothetical protein
MVRTAALIFGLLGSSAFAQMASTERAQYKNATIGMALADWKALPFPDGGNARPTCSDDPDARKMLVPPTTPDGALGVVTCYYVNGRWPALPSIGASWKMLGLQYSFLNNRLYLVQGVAGIDATSDIVSGLTARFGEPVSANKGVVQNRLGASFPQVQYKWKLGSDVIEVGAPGGGKVNTVSVTYGDTAALSLLTAARERANPSAGKM